MIKFLILIAVPICIFEGIPLFRNKKWRELITLGVLIGLSLIIGIGKQLGIMTPIELLDLLLMPLGKTFFKHF